MKSKKIYYDMLLNIAAAGIPLVILQLVIYPFAAKKIDSDVYGLMIAFYALLLLINDSLGKSANNIRLINNKEEENKKGDYNILVLIYAVVGAAVSVFGVVFYGAAGNFIDMAILVTTGVLMVYNAYLIVFFRIRLNYIAILINAICMSAGFALGFLLFCLTSKWSLIFLFGHLACFTYLTIKTRLLSEPFKTTVNFKKLFSDTTILAISVLLSQGMGQVDKLLLFPLMGGTSVSIYYTAALAGKIMSLATGPVNSVILTYIAGKDSLTRKTFRRYMLVCTAACLSMAVVILLLSRPILGFLFPQFVDEAMILVPYTTANIFLFVMAGMVTPLVMRYCDIRWQIGINGIGFVLYTALAILLLHFYGTIGFCIGIGISHLVRLIMMIVIYNHRAYE